MSETLTEPEPGTRRKSASRAFLVQPRAQKTRVALLSVVERIVAAEGAQAVTTTRVAQESGVAVGTIYRYFDDREALLLAAYDGTVQRIVDESARLLGGLPDTMSAAEAAARLLDAYLATAAAIPAHGPLLAAMRALRPVGADQAGDNLSSVSERLLRPFVARFAAGAAMDMTRVHFAGVLVGTMVDLYLTAPDDGRRMALKDEIDAHLALIVARLISPAMPARGV